MASIEGSAPDMSGERKRSELVRRHWPAALLLIILGAVSTYLLFGLGLRLTSEAAASNGLVLGAWGLAISIAGFSLTLWQLRRTKTATESVERAISSILRRVKTSDLSVEAGRLIKFLETAIVHIGHSSWANASHSLWEAQTLLTRLQDGLELGEEKLALLRKSGDDLLNYIQILDGLAGKSAKYHDTSPMLRSIRVLINIMDQAIILSKKELYNA